MSLPIPFFFHTRLSLVVSFTDTLSRPYKVVSSQITFDRNKEILDRLSYQLFYIQIHLFKKML